MEYIVVADTALGIEPERFARMWNENGDCSRVATAMQREAAHDIYDGGLSTVLVLLGGIAIGVAGNTVYDLVKKVVLGAILIPEEHEYEVVREDRRDGVHVIRIRRIE